MPVAGSRRAAPPHRAVDGTMHDLGRVGIPGDGADMRLIETLRRATGSFR